MRAWIGAGSSVSRPRKLSRDEILAALGAAGIAITSEVESRILSYLELFAGGDARGAEIPPRYLIAVGQPPCPPRAATIEFCGADFEAPGGVDEQGDLPTSAHVVMVEEGAVVGRWIPAAPGKPGVDVYGGVISPASVVQEGCIGDGLKRTAEGIVIAERSGRVVRINDTWTVATAVTLNGEDVVGEICPASHVRIVGNLGSGAAIRTVGGVRVEGAVEGGRIIAADDIVVTGGVFSRGGRDGIRTEMNLMVRFCDGAVVTARGDVEIQNESINSRIHADGRVVVRAGGVVGGCLHATRGGDMAALGNEAGIPTLVSIGVHPNLLLEARRLNEEVRQIEKRGALVNARVQPLVANLKRLTSTQKEQLTALLQEARQIAASLEQAQRALSDAQTGIAAIEPACLRVRGILHAGVCFRVGMREACIRTDFRGPLTLESRVVRGMTELIISFESGRSQVLASAESPPDAAWQCFEEQWRS